MILAYDYIYLFLINDGKEVTLFYYSKGRSKKVIIVFD